MIDTGAFTDALLAMLADGGVLVGDGVAPESGGWDKGQPQVSRFVPYATLGFSGGGVHIDPIAPLGGEDWSLSFSLRSFGGSRKQVDWVAASARAIVVSVGAARPLVGGFRVARVSWQSLGAVSRVDSVDPPYWQVYDAFSLLCMNDE